VVDGLLDKPSLLELGPAEGVRLRKVHKWTLVVDRL
jgi:hypothetical protein